MNTAGLYIHIPFCKTKCHYCSFNSYPCAVNPPKEYAAALIDHLRILKEFCQPQRVISSVYFGGGTPTIYSARVLDEVLNSCRDIFTIDAQAEITIETNPNTVSVSSLEELINVGFNRISIGVQAFDDALLSALGRSHTSLEARTAILSAKEVGFDNINIDLMYGLPGQTPAVFKETLEQALAINPQHIALYELTVEEDTVFSKMVETGDLILPGENRVLEMEELVQTLLPASGYKRYEISNYSRPDLQSKHNINYWQNGSYCGVGAGAVSYIDGLRIKNVESPDSYVSQVASKNPYKEIECLSTEAAFRETIIMGLRMLSGVKIAPLKKRFDLNPIDYYGATIQKLLAEGLIDIDECSMKLTSRALPVANQVLSQLV